MDKISVIVPVYNVVDYLPKCLDSVCNQTYTNIEIVVIEDGSTDGSVSICDEYARIDNRIILRHKSNQGISMARNDGLNIASGKYVMFVDSDDFLEKNAIEILYGYIIKYSTDIVVGRYRNIDENNNVFEGYGYEQTNDNGEYKIISGNEVLHNRYVTHAMDYVVVWQKLYKRSLWNSIRFPEKVLHEDEKIFRAIYSVATSILTLNKVVYYYRKRKNSVMSKMPPQRYVDMLSWINDEIIYYSDINDSYMKNEAMRHYCNMFIQYYDNKKNKKILKKYVRKVLWSKQLTKRTFLKFAISYFSIPLYRILSL